MERHVDRVEKIFVDAGIKFTRLCAPKSFEHYMFEYKPKRRNLELAKHDGMTWPGPRARWCTAMLKTRIVSRYLDRLRNEYNVIQLVGLAADEQHRIDRQTNQDPTHRHPLAEWGWTEADCLQYCYDLGFDWEGLYEIFHRVSCWCCPLQSFDELRKLRKHFPDLWERLREMDRKTWRTFLKEYSVDDLDVRFAFEEERLAAGMSITSREFHNEMKLRIAEARERRL